MNANSAELRQAVLPFAILAEEMKALERFHECVTDGEGYDVPNEMMRRLAEIGLVRRVTVGTYEHTTFGLAVLNGDFAGCTAAQGEQSKCVCGDPAEGKIVHRSDGPCYVEQAGSAEQASERDDWKALAIAAYEGWKKGYDVSGPMNAIARATLSALERKVTDDQIMEVATDYGWNFEVGDLYFPKDALLDFARALLNQQGEQTAPEGFVMVPKEPTDDWFAEIARRMSRWAGPNSMPLDWYLTDAQRFHRAMIAAAQSTAQKDGGNNG